VTETAINSDRSGGASATPASVCTGVARS
jgi:hypothetical protein